MRRRGEPFLRAAPPRRPVRPTADTGLTHVEGPQASGQGGFALSKGLIQVSVRMLAAIAINKIVVR